MRWLFMLLLLIPGSLCATPNHSSNGTVSLTISTSPSPPSPGGSIRGGTGGWSGNVSSEDNETDEDIDDEEEPLEILIPANQSSMPNETSHGEPRIAMDVDPYRESGKDIVYEEDGGLEYLPLLIVFAMCIGGVVLILKAPAHAGRHVKQYYGIKPAKPKKPKKMR